MNIQNIVLLVIPNALELSYCLPMSLVENWRSGLSLAECNMYMLTHEIHCDVTFKIGNEGKTVRAHKYVLASRSPVFDTMLYGDWAETDDIRVPEIELSSFNALLRFMYCGDVSFTPDTVISMLYAADKYRVDNLVNKITSYLNQHMTDENVITILESAQLFNLDDLVKTCKDYIKLNPAPLLQSSTALEISKENLAFIISLDSLLMDELQIYQFLIQWAESQCETVGMEKTDENVRTMMGDLIYHIRFQSMDTYSFTNEVCNRAILDAEEKSNLQHVIVGDLDKKNTKFKHEERKSETFRVLRGDIHDTDAIWTYDAPFGDNIEFTVKRNVRIHGFIMWGGRSVPYTYTVQGKLYDNTNEISAVPVQTIERRDQVDKTFTILLSQPVVLVPGMRYRAWVRLEGPNSWGGQNYKSSVTELHGVEFVFYTYNGENNGTWERGGQFPGFLCSV